MDQENDLGFRLPMMATVSIARENESIVAHALDFDIVAEAGDENEALEKLRLGVQVYIEYAVAHNWSARDIRRMAPKSAWDRLTPESAVRLIDPIVINHEVMHILRAEAIEQQFGNCDPVNARHPLNRPNACPFAKSGDDS